MTEDDPTFLSDDESEQVFQILDRTPQIDRKEALRRVIGDERMRRLVEAEEASNNSVEEPGRANKQPSRPLSGKLGTIADAHAKEREVENEFEQAAAREGAMTEQERAEGAEQVRQILEHLQRPPEPPDR